ncbi:MAG TPA: cytochrome c biogenesis protein CcdA, partial [Tepidisphaeraceae bacterium]|nr:cytochrome c biogenesis protein CcdA [Tepidisphaeraceae bacterium]
MPPTPRRALPLLLLALSLCASHASAQIAKATVTTALNVSALSPGKDAVLAVIIDIPDKLHAQSNKPNDPAFIPLVVTPDKLDTLTLGEPIYPKGKDETYPELGAVPLNVYDGRVIVYVPIKVPADAKPGDVTLSGKAQVQMCTETTCYPPQRPKWTLATKIAAPGDAVTPANADTFKNYTPPAPGTDTAKPNTSSVAPPPPARAVGPTATAARSTNQAGPPPVQVDVAGKPTGLFHAMLIALAAGVLFNVVPCVLPVLPIKVLGFAEVAHHNRAKTLLLATIFGLGIVTVFAALSIPVMVLQKISWGQQFSNPYFAWGTVVVLLAMSLWLFGILDFNLPSGAYAFVPNHETYAGQYLWGILTALLSTPCTGPLFTPVMFWATSQPPAIGVTIMLLTGVGMALPYIVLSAFPELARKFPRVGPWAELFKQMMGFVMLGFTVWFAAGRFPSETAKWWAVVPVAAMGAFYLLARTVQLTKNAAPVAISAALAVLLLGTSVYLGVIYTDFR